MWDLRAWLEGGGGGLGVVVRVCADSELPRFVLYRQLSRQRGRSSLCPSRRRCWVGLCS